MGNENEVNFYKGASRLSTESQGPVWQFDERRSN